MYPLILVTSTVSVWSASLENAAIYHELKNVQTFLSQIKGSILLVFKELVRLRILLRILSPY